MRGNPIPSSPSLCPEYEIIFGNDIISCEKPLQHKGKCCGYTKSVYANRDTLIKITWKAKKR